jgi:putative aldouronate transport system substrate-binding protein
MTADWPRVPLNRRSFLGAAAATAGALAAAPLLTACGTSGVSGPGATSASQLTKILPAYIPSALVKPDIPSVNGSDPGYLSYPTNLVRTVSETPGAGGTYTTITPLWGSIPPAGNAYYEAVNKALGANLVIQPSNGNLYGTFLPTLFSGNKLPDWIDIPSYMTQPLNFGQAVAAKFTDLTPYLSGDKIKKYPNLAAIPAGGWQAGIWNGKIYGIPSFPANAAFAGAIYYRADILDRLGIGTPSIKSAQDLLALGKEVNDPKGKRWAFDDIWTYLQQPYGIPNGPPEWTQNAKGDLVASYETEQIIEAMVFEHSIYAAGLMHPDAVALESSSAKQRFWSGQEVITGDGTGAWNGDDALSGKAANPSYVRMGLPPFTASGTGTPTYPLQNSGTLYSYLAKSLSKNQIEECLRIANYLAAPFGSYEYTLVNFGVQAVDWTTSAAGPVYTTQGTKNANQDTFQFLVTGPSVQFVQSGYTDVVKAYCAWEQQACTHAYKPLFYDMNVSYPASFNSAMAAGNQGGALYDMINNVVRGRNTVADYKAAVKSWQANGGNAMRRFFDGIRAKYGDV